MIQLQTKYKEVLIIAIRIAMHSYEQLCTFHHSYAQLWITVSNGDGMIITISANLLIVGNRADACVLSDCCSLHHIGDLFKNLEVFGLLRYQGHHLVVVALGHFHHVAQDLVGPLLHHSDGRSGDA